MVRSSFLLRAPSLLFSELSSVSDIYIYDGEKWQSSVTSLPYPLQGSCAVEFMGKILLIGGKNEKDIWQGSKSILQFDPENQTWAHRGLWPSTNLQHFYHGCSKAVVKGVPGIKTISKASQCLKIIKNVSFHDFFELSEFEDVSLQNAEMS